MIKKYCRVMYGAVPAWGVVESNCVCLIDGDLFGRHVITDTRFVLSELKLLPPVTPTKIICVGLNYRDHVKESQSSNVVPEEPVLFMKPLTDLIGHDDAIVLPAASQRVDFEGEIGVVVKSQCRHLSPEAIEKEIFGIACVNDVTARDLQKKDTQWTRGKGFDTFCPVGPYLVTGLDYGNLNITSRLNGETRQSSNSSNMIFHIPQLLSFINNVMTLMPGDLIVTGTPQGVGPMQDGDVIEIEVEGVGFLRNKARRQE